MQFKGLYDLDSLSGNRTSYTNYLE